MTFAATSHQINRCDHIHAVPLRRARPAAVLRSRHAIARLFERHAIARLFARHAIARLLDEHHDDFRCSSSVEFAVSGEELLLGGLSVVPSHFRVDGNIAAGRPQTGALLTP